MGVQRENYPECSLLFSLSIDAKMLIQKYKDIYVVLHTR